MSHGQIPNEADVIAGCRRGARWARQALFERHHRAIYRFLIAQCGDTALAEDMTQETFLRAYEAMATFRGDARVSSWMTRIALNCLYEVHRRREVRRRYVEGIPRADPRGGWVTGGISRSEEARLQRDLVRRALARLDPDDASIIVLHDLQGYRYRELATALQIAIGTVGSRLSRARQRLRAIANEISRPPEESDLAAHPTSESEATESGDGVESNSPSTASHRVVWSEP